MIMYRLKAIEEKQIQISKIYKKLKQYHSFMSVTISNCDQICQSPSNTSPSKMLYSFPKGDRFPRTRKTLCEKFYDSTFIEAARSTTFGFGRKCDLSKTTRLSPPCNTYHLKSDFDFSNTDRKGFGFGKGREQMKTTGPLVDTLKNKNPGPGTYKMPNSLQKLSYSFTSRNQLNNKEKAKVPGPGYYPVALSINQKGKYPVSKLKNVLARNFSTTLGRIQKIENKAPAPGAYDLSKSNLSPQGRYCLSKMENSKVRKFGTSLRSSLADKKETPGPGNYKLPSQFGHYVSSKFKESLHKFSKKEDKENIVGPQ